MMTDPSELSILSENMDILDIKVRALAEQVERMARAIKRLEGMMAVLTVLQ